MNSRPLRTTRKIANLQERPGWYRIANQAAGPAKVTIYDEIGMLGVSADMLLRDLAGIDGDVELHLNSPGGDVFDGIAIYNQLRQRDGVVAVVVDGLAASAASFIAQAASPGHLRMAPHSQMMIHDGFGMAIGNAADMREMADLLDKASDNIARIYATRTGRDPAYWRERMRSETWYDDHEAVAEGLADSVVGQERPKDKWDLSVYLNAPAVVNADGNHGPTSDTHMHAHPDMQGGSHSHMHRHDGEAQHSPHVTRWDPDGDGDDDTHPETDTDHDHWNADGTPVRHAHNKWPEAGFWNKDYPQADRDRMAKSGQAMPDGSYPIADEEDLHNAIRAVGRGGSDHDAIRRHIIKRAKALGKSDAIPDNWNADGTVNKSTDEIWMELAVALEGSE